MVLIRRCVGDKNGKLNHTFTNMNHGICSFILVKFSFAFVTYTSLCISNDPDNGSKLKGVCCLH